MFYYSGPRNLQIMHTRLRTQCSALNSHLFNKTIVNSPLCLCRSEETSKHFLLHCPRYENQRLKMLNSLGIILTDTPALTITTDLLLSGSEHQLIKTHDFLTLFLSSSVNPNALVVTHSYCQVHCLPICTFFPYYITFFQL